ncbi:MAG: NusA-like transcription termination signal-binding factor [Candidatus Hodarchaeaceae archaeon]|nr:NusA-like transcription termination signal-binding factor [Candidatus Hodarchaeaceae archaeon]
MGFKLGADEMRYIALFESLTGATVRDCLVFEKEGKLILVVNQGDIGLAIGKGGSRVQKAKRVLGKSIEVVEYSDDPAELIKNALAPAKISGVSIVEREGKKLAFVEVEAKDKGLAVGRGGRNIQRAKMLALRHHGIQDVFLT